MLAEHSAIVASIVGPEIVKSSGPKINWAAVKAEIKGRVTL